MSRTSHRNRNFDLPGWWIVDAQDGTPSLTKTEQNCRTALKADYLQTYKDTQTGQSDAIGQASGTRSDRNSLVEQATERRMWLQFAADAEWPHTDPATRAYIG